MESKLKDELNLNARVLTYWHRWQPDSNPQLIRQLDGLSNTSYLLKLVNKFYVLRINGLPNPAVNRHREAYILRALQGQPFAPVLLYADAECMIQAYLGEEASYSPAMLGQVLGRLHLQASIQGNPINLISLLSFYSTELKLDASATPALRLAQEFNLQDVPIGLCHNDVNQNNIITTESGLKLIDWEYAQTGPIWFDLAVAIETHQWHTDEVDQFLNAYSGHAADIPRLDSFRLFYRLLEKLWYARHQPTPDLLAWLDGWHQSAKHNSGFQQL